MKLYNMKNKNNRNNIMRWVASNVAGTDKPWTVQINLDDKDKQDKQEKITLP